MAMGNLANICQQLVAHGRAPQTPVAVIQDGTRPTRRADRRHPYVDRGDRRAGGHWRARDHRGRRGRAPARRTALVRSCAALRKARADHASGAAGAGICTRALTRAGWSRYLPRRSPSFRPTIPRLRIGPSTSWPRTAGSYSPRRTASTRSSIASQVSEDADARYLGATKVAAIGSKTAERLRAFGVRADLVPAAF